MKIHFTVHVYAEEKLYDEVLIPHRCIDCYSAVNYRKINFK